MTTRREIVKFIFAWCLTPLLRIFPDLKEHGKFNLRGTPWGRIAAEIGTLGWDNLKGPEEEVGGYHRFLNECHCDVDWRINAPCTSEGSWDTWYLMWNSYKLLLSQDCGLTFKTIFSIPPSVPEEDAAAAVRKAAKLVLDVIAGKKPPDIYMI